MKQGKRQIWATAGALIALAPAYLFAGGDDLPTLAEVQQAVKEVPAQPIEAVPIPVPRNSTTMYQNEVIAAFAQLVKDEHPAAQGSDPALKFVREYRDKYQLVCEKEAGGVRVSETQTVGAHGVLTNLVPHPSKTDRECHEAGKKDGWVNLMGPEDCLINVPIPADPGHQMTISTSLLSQERLSQSPFSLDYSDGGADDACRFLYQGQVVSQDLIKKAINKALPPPPPPVYYSSGPCIELHGLGASGMVQTNLPRC